MKTHWLNGANPGNIFQKIATRLNKTVEEIRQIANDEKLKIVVECRKCERGYKNRMLDIKECFYCGSDDFIYEDIRPDRTEIDRILEKGRCPQCYEPATILADEENEKLIVNCDYDRCNITSDEIFTLKQILRLIEIRDSTSSPYKFGYDTATSESVVRRLSDRRNSETAPVYLKVKGVRHPIGNIVYFEEEHEFVIYAEDLFRDHDDSSYITVDSEATDS